RRDALRACYHATVADRQRSDTALQPFENRRDEANSASSPAFLRSLLESGVRRDENADATVWAIVPAGRPCSLGEMVATGA
ncbi:MAG TPA: hypothetical protein VMS22_24665, partial [Candidatus Eisenbacteria bacterium]|nr:hypothetical protein [Candidatus Eisenbacteria bacterium]